MYWMASSAGMTLASAKKADWSTVLVRLPMPTLSGQVDSVDQVDVDVVVRDVALGHGGQVLVELLALHWQLTRKVPPGLTSRTISKPLTM